MLQYFILLTFIILVVSVIFHLISELVHMKIFFSTSERELWFFALFVFLLKQMRFDNFWLKRNLASVTITLIYYNTDKNYFYRVMYHLFCSTTWRPLENYIYKDSNSLSYVASGFIFTFSQVIFCLPFTTLIAPGIYTHTHFALSKKTPCTSFIYPLVFIPTHWLLLSGLCLFHSLPLLFIHYQWRDQTFNACRTWLSYPVESCGPIC